MRRLMVRFTAVGVLVGALSMLGVGPAHAQYICDNTFPGLQGATINDNVVVPANKTCNIGSNSTINGNITMQSGSSLDFRNSTVKGSITATNPLGINILFATVVGTTNVNGTVPNGGFLICGSALSSLAVSNGGATGGFWLIGADNPIVFCSAGNTFGGPVQFTNNANDVEFQGNQANSSVVAQGNSGHQSTINGNTIGGSLQVQNNNPCWPTFNNTVAGRTIVQPCA